MFPHDVLVAKILKTPATESYIYWPWCKTLKKLKIINITNCFKYHKKQKEIYNETIDHGRVAEI